ncbi:helix-hairpin-helix domain-containing protein [Aeromicrobium sp.]|uniref:helix-hairpin-helix domain-containing protein n=1 Tax=Aeromicrobium sp. TaxID=1871063 RepID=UPI003D6BB09E
MRPQQPTDTGETRAEIARRRLAQLAASFEAEIPHSKPDPEPVVVPRRVDRAHARVLVTIAVAAGVLLTWWLLAERPRTSSPEALSLSTAASAAPGTATPSAEVSASGEVVVDVAGKVKRPGIVSLPAGSRVHEAIAEAGGVRGKADTSTINMARVLTDGEQILVGVAPVAGPAPASASGSAAAGARISLGSATLEQLDTLPGIGPVTAQAILDYRSEHGAFTSVDDLLDVKGIGEATLADIRDRVTP